MVKVPKTLLVQHALRAAGCHPGPSDGFWGDRTAQALSDALGKVGIEQSPQSVEDLTADIFDSLTDVFNLQLETLDSQHARLQETMSSEAAKYLISRVGLGANPAEMHTLAGLTRSAQLARWSLILRCIIHNYHRQNFSQTLSNLLGPQRFLEEGEQQNFRMERDKEMANLRLCWVREMLATERPAGALGSLLAQSFRNWMFQPQRKCTRVGKATLDLQGIWSYQLSRSHAGDGP